MIETLARPDRPSVFGAKDEVVVTFKLTETRDTVIGASAKLAGCVTAAGQPTAGIRLEIPRGLKDDFNSLRKFGQLLRTRHGLGTRRHVKFDDGNMSLFLNVKLPGDDRWSRVDLELARKSLSSRRRLDSQELESRFDVLGSSGNRPARSASSSGPVASTSSDPPPQQWTGRRTSSS